MKTAIPSWLLKSNSPDIERLKAVYVAIQEEAQYKLYRRSIDYPLRSGFEIPKAMPWRPPIITTVPNTQVVIKALHTGVLRRRLSLGIERIYISEMVLIRAPSCAQKLINLAIEFPARLVIAPAIEGSSLADSMKLKKARAIEYYFTGSSLTYAYEEEFDYEKNWKPHALDDVETLRVGDIPRGITFLISHEHFVPEAAWETLNMEGVRHITERAKFNRKRENDRGAKVLGDHLNMFRAHSPSLGEARVGSSEGI